MKYIISACLCGYNCKYNGKNNLNKNIKKIYDNHDAILVCPEVMGGLDTPRVPCEIVGNMVINKEGRDCTKEYTLGAEKTLKVCLENNIKCAILKEKSPSCGVNYIYDGTFNNNLIEGCGITTRLLRENNIEVISDVMFGEDNEEK